MHATLTGKGIEAGRVEAPVVGQVIAWSSDQGRGPALEVPVETVRHALATCGIEKSVTGRTCRDIRPRNAIIRAINRMKTGRIIRRLDEDRVVRPTKKNPHPPSAYIRFQFTREYLEGVGYSYDREMILAVNKVTGAISDVAPLNESAPEERRIARARLIDLARGEFARARDTRTAADITRYVQQLCVYSDRDLHRVRGTGGVYLVFSKDLPFVDGLDQFITACGGHLDRLSVAADNSSKSTIASAVVDTIERLLESHTKALDGVSGKTRRADIEKMADKIQKTEAKLRAYSVYLEGAAEKYREELVACRARVRRALEALVKGGGPATDGDEAGEPEGADEPQAEPVIAN